MDSNTTIKGLSNKTDHKSMLNEALGQIQAIIDLTLARAAFRQTLKSLPANGVAVWKTASKVRPSRHFVDTVSLPAPNCLTK